MILSPQLPVKMRRVKNAIGAMSANARYILCYSRSKISRKIGMKVALFAYDGASEVKVRVMATNQTFSPAFSRLPLKTGVFHSAEFAGVSFC